MKKYYITPSVETIEIELEGFLAYSTGINDEDATIPAKAREIIIDDDDWLEE